MADPADRRLAVLWVLVAGLLVAVIVQSAVIFGMNRKLNQQVRTALQSSASMAGHDQNGSHPRAVALPMPMDPDNDPLAREFDNWDPFKEMHSMQDRINQMFGSAFNRFQQSDDFGVLSRAHPFASAINVEDKGDHFLVTVDLPGTEDSQLDVKLEDRTLTISGSVQSESKGTDKGRMLRQERRSGEFQRTVTLPGPVKADQMTTTNQKGVVTITIPKAKE